MKKLIVMSLLLAGCSQEFRYPCQNPDNWDKDICKKPLCEVNRDCPEYVFESTPTNPAQDYTPAEKELPKSKGGCK